MYYFFCNLGLILAFIFVIKYKLEFYSITRDEFVQAAFVIGLFAYYGAHFGWMLSPAGESERSSLLSWLAFYKGGISSTGVLGALLASMLIAAWKKRKVTKYIPLVLESGLLVLAFVRIGCTYNHEHLGRLAPEWLGFTDSVGNFRHDLGLYECIFLWVFFVPVIWVNRNDPIKSVNFTFHFLVFFLAFRFLVELLRNDVLNPANILFASAYLIAAIFIYLFRKVIKSSKGDFREPEAAF